MTTDTIRPGGKKVATTRETRGLELYRTRAGEIEEIAPDIYLVPSQDGERTYRVQYGESEYCSCPDHSYRAVNCVHILAVGIAHAKRRRRRECSLCYGAGVIMIGVEEDGREWTEPVPCRRCGGSGGR